MIEDKIQRTTIRRDREHSIQIQSNLQRLTGTQPIQWVFGAMVKVNASQKLCSANDKESGSFR